MESNSPMSVKIFKKLSSNKIGVS